MIAVLLFWLLRSLLILALATLLGAMFDKGHPNRGRFLDDLPSTLGLLAGVFISIVDLICVLH
jgi:hypothetical protein